MPFSKLDREPEKIIIHTPVKLAVDDISTIRKFMAKNYSIQARAEIKLDKSLIAGIKISFKDLELDYSLTGKLSRLEKSIT